MKVKYIGKKMKFPVIFPVGAKSRGLIKETKIVSAGEEFEVSDEDAHKLVALNLEHPQFAYADPSVVPPVKEALASTPVAEVSDESATENPAYEEYEPEAKSKKGKKK